MTGTLCGRLLAGRAAVTLGLSALLTADLLFLIFFILSVILFTRARIFSAVLATYAARLLAVGTDALT